MRAPMARRTKVTLAAGVLVFVGGGVGAAYMAARPEPAPQGGGAPQATVYYTTQNVNTGTAGSVALAQGLVRPRNVAAAEVPDGAVTSEGQLAGRVAASTIPAGTVVLAEMFPAPQTRIGTVVIPPGKRALAVELEPVAGVAGFVGAGDLIDIYGVARGQNGPAGVQLVLQAVEVLNVNGAGLPSAQGQPNGPNLVYLLAVTPAEAERLIYLTKFEELYFDLVPRGEPPVVTPGAGPGQALQAI